MLSHSSAVLQHSQCFHQFTTKVQLATARSAAHASYLRVLLHPAPRTRSHTAPAKARRTPSKTTCIHALAGGHCCLRLLLAPGFEVLGEAASERDLLVLALAVQLLRCPSSCHQLPSLSCQLHSLAAHRSNQLSDVTHRLSMAAVVLLQLLLLLLILLLLQHQHQHQQQLPANFAA
jgi:hypothetical protein